jgi:hypothetical protein
MSPEAARAAELELPKELSASHSLRGISCRPLAQRLDCDDVLFATPGAVQPFAVVHLTWSGHTDPNEGWPWTTFYDSLERWRTDCMIPDHKDYTS